MSITDDDDKFEHYLKQFRPVASEPLRIERRSRLAWRWWLLGLPAAAALAILVAVLGIRFRHRPVQRPDAKNKSGIEHLANTPPLTLGRANGLLAQAPSFEAALDEVAFHRERSPLSKGTRSALATLSKEGVKL